MTEISHNILWSGQFEDKYQLGGVFHSLLPPALYQCQLERIITCLHYILVLLVLTVNNKLTELHSSIFFLLLTVGNQPISENDHWKTDRLINDS